MWNPIENIIGDEGYKAIFINPKTLSNLEFLILFGKSKMKLECGITSKSSDVMNESLKYMSRLVTIDFSGKINNRLNRQ